MTQMPADENSITTAIQVAGSHYSHAEGLRWPTFAAPANNQQGAALNQLCGDLLVAFGDYKIGLFEVKELVNGQLREFREEQHRDCLDFESLGVPIQYAYGPARLLENLEDGNSQSAAKILASINYCAPSELMQGTRLKVPHEELKSWFDFMGRRGSGDETGGDTPNMWTVLGCVEGSMRTSAVGFRNSHLLLLYSAKLRHLEIVTPKQVLAFGKLLRGERANLAKNLIEPLGELLGKSDAVLSAFNQIKRSRQATAVAKRAPTAIQLTNTDASNSGTSDAGAQPPRSGSSKNTPF